jgi:hypothetical protein
MMMIPSASSNFDRLRLHLLNSPNWLLNLLLSPVPLPTTTMMLLHLLRYLQTLLRVLLDNPRHLLRIRINLKDNLIEEVGLRHELDDCVQVDGDVRDFQFVCFEEVRVDAAQYGLMCDDYYWVGLALHPVYDWLEAGD